MLPLPGQGHWQLESGTLKPFGGNIFDDRPVSVRSSTEFSSAEQIEYVVDISTGDKKQYVSTEAAAPQKKDGNLDALIQ